MWELQVHNSVLGTRLAKDLATRKANPSEQFNSATHGVSSWKACKKQSAFPVASRSCQKAIPKHVHPVLKVVVMTITVAWEVAVVDTATDSYFCD